MRAGVVDKPRGSNCLEQGLNVDLFVSQSFPFVAGSELSFVGGYDQHGVTGFDRDNTLVFGAVRQPTGAVMLGYDLPVPLIGELDARAGWNVANSQPRVSLAFGLRDPDDDAAARIVFAADCTGTDGADPYCDASLTWSRGFGDGWEVALAFEHSNGLEHLPDPFGGRADAPAANEANGVRGSIRWRFK